MWRSLWKCSNVDANHACEESWCECFVYILLGSDPLGQTTFPHLPLPQAWNRVNNTDFVVSLHEVVLEARGSKVLFFSEVTPASPPRSGIKWSRSTSTSVTREAQSSPTYTWVRRWVTGWVLYLYDIALLWLQIYVCFHANQHLDVSMDNVWFTSCQERLP